MELRCAGSDFGAIITFPATPRAAFSLKTTGVEAVVGSGFGGGAPVNNDISRGLHKPRTAPSGPGDFGSDIGTGSDFGEKFHSGGDGSGSGSDGRG